MRGKIIPDEDKLKFWQEYNKLPKKEFAAKAREVLGYSEKTVPADILSSITKAAHRLQRG